MTKAKKRRKEQEDEIEEETNEQITETMNNKKSKKKSDQSELNDATKRKKKSKEISFKRSTEITADSKPSHANGVHMASLQSIFATKDSAEGTFTLFGGEPIENEETPETVQSQSVPVSTSQPSSSHPGEQKTKYFFPHFDFPERNHLSLFHLSDEPFFHQRTEYACSFGRKVIVGRRRGGFGTRGGMS